MLGQLLERLWLEPPVEVEVHDRLRWLASRGCTTRGDAAVRVALEPEDRVQRALHAEALGGDARARAESTRNGRSSDVVSSTEPARS